MLNNVPKGLSLRLLVMEGKIRVLCILLNGNTVHGPTEIPVSRDLPNYISQTLFTIAPDRRHARYDIVHSRVSRQNNW